MTERQVRDEDRRKRSERKKRFWSKPYNKFLGATHYDRRVQVAEDPKAQAGARRLIAARKVVAYENAQGLIKDIGVPKKPEKGGKVYSRKAAQSA